MNKQKEMEQLIFNKHNNAAIIFSITVIVTILTLFLYVSIKVYETHYCGLAYWGIIFLTLFGVMLIPCKFSRYFFNRYCHKVENMGDEMQVFITVEYKQKREKEIQNIIEIIACIGGFTVCIIFSVLYFASPELFLYR